MVNLWNVVSGVNERIGTANIPSEITSGDIYNLADDCRLDIQSFTGQTIDNTNISESFISPLKNMTSAFVMGRILGIDIDTEIGVGNIRLAYGTQFQAENKQMEFFMERANHSLNLIGRTIVQDYTLKTG